jgi:hypothetical protein
VTRWLEHILLVFVVAAIVWLFAIYLPNYAAGDPPPIAITATESAPPPALLPPRYAGHDAGWWHTAYLAQRRRTHALKRTLLRQPSVTEALNLACAVYGDCATLWRRARCESHLYRYAANRGSSARGLLQFLTTGWVRRYGDHARVNGGTWATTPFWRFSPFSPYANALAAGWMLSVAHRGSEWSCR